ncbi:MAG: hypothetical protein KA974_09300 [Saprospiraceae bacterium]|nr:hypothetical protein [Saprospiraceae bacterium]MBP7679991.1 hypothetical protein [Saprospiraceae bacterium]
MSNYRNTTINTTNTLAGIAAFALILIGLYYIASFVFKVLYFVAPVLLIITLLLNYRIVTDYLAGLVDTLRRNPVMGILGILLTVVAYPVVIFMLFGKALLVRKVQRMQTQFQEQFAPPKESEAFSEYEEIKTDEPAMREEMPPIEEKAKQQRNQYDQFFEK